MAAGAKVIPIYGLGLKFPSIKGAAWAIAAFDKMLEFTTNVTKGKVHLKISAMKAEYVAEGLPSFDVVGGTGPAHLR